MTRLDRASIPEAIVYWFLAWGWYVTAKMKTFITRKGSSEHR